MDLQDKIRIKNLSIDCSVGVTEKERKKMQKILLSLTIFQNIEDAARSDNIEHTIDYKELADKIVGYVKNKDFKLIESIALDISSLIKNKYKVDKVIVSIKKPGALPDAEYAEVEIVR